MECHHRLSRIQSGIPDQIAALLSRLQAGQMRLGDLFERLLVVGVAAERLHVHRNTRLVFTDQLQNGLIEFRPVIPAVTLDQLDALTLLIILKRILTIHMETGDIKMQRLAR